MVNYDRLYFFKCILYCNLIFFNRYIGLISLQADSGGPLMIRKGLKMIVVGIVSTGIGCARASLPGIYTRISEFIDWIAVSIR